MLKLTQVVNNLDQQLESSQPTMEIVVQLETAFQSYLQHGGYLTVINDFAATQQISPFVLATYSDWIRGDMIKRGKGDHHCKEFFTAMTKRLNSQITWNALVKDFSIDHHQTVASYAALLMSMDVIYVQQALIEDKLTGAAKKARKLLFTDPFIYHAVVAWLNPTKDPYGDHILPALHDTKLTAYLVESCVVSHFNRWYPTYYIKSDGEVDVAYVDKNRFWPVEVKWTTQIRPNDLKQIQKYSNGIILGKQSQIVPVNHLKSYPLPWYLARFSNATCEITLFSLVVYNVSDH